MNITDEIINRFFTGQCSYKEKKYVARYFEEHPLEADKYFVDWINTSKWSDPIDNNITKRIFKNVHNSIAEKKGLRKKWYVSLSSIAAIILLCVGIRYFIKQQPVNEFRRVIHVKPNPIVTYSNNKSVIDKITLSDSSVIELYPNSTISYLSNFETNKRDIHLKGEAIFKVNKDEQRPFTVYSNQISTTALGTRFRVKITNDHIAVMLYEGKVLVKKASDILKELNANDKKYVSIKNKSINIAYKKYYLTAGNEIVYNTISNKFSSIINFLSIQDKQPTIEVSKKTTVAPISPLIEMKNIAMASALDILSAKFNVQIEYSPDDVKDIYIIATVNQKQPINHILKDIATMNNLNIKKLGTQQYIIYKK